MKQRTIYITLETSGDEFRDNLRLRRIIGMFTSYAGMDTLIVRQNDKEHIIGSANVDQGILDNAIKLVGKDNVFVTANDSRSGGQNEWMSI